MADNDNNENMINIPSPPAHPDNHGHWFIYGEWMRLVETSALATPENPNPQGVRQVKVGSNEVIAMHPACYLIIVQQARPGYTVRAMVKITKEMYDWYKTVERMIQAAIAQKNGN